MLWRRALSSLDGYQELSPEEEMLQKRLARKREEVAGERVGERCLPPLHLTPEKPQDHSLESTPLNTSKEPFSTRNPKLLTPLPQRSPKMQEQETPSVKEEIISPSQASTYFGVPAREQFFQRYQWLSRQHSLQLSPMNSKQKSGTLIFEEDKLDSLRNVSKFTQDESIKMDSPLGTPTSPRSKYIFECIASHLNPRPGLLIRKKLTNELKLSHYGMGDQMAIKLSAVLADLPMVTVLNLADNHLTDVGLKPLLDQIVTMPNLVELNLSENTIGPLAAEALGKYLRRPALPLKRLLLCKSNVDDFEGEKFVQALVGNQTIVELDLSQNLLGHAELLNVVRPNLITAAEALAVLLQQDTCKLQELKLSWNMIRLDSAVQLSQSLAINSSLTYLDLSYNGIGQNG